MSFRVNFNIIPIPYKSILLYIFTDRFKEMYGAAITIRIAVITNKTLPGSMVKSCILGATKRNAFTKKNAPISNITTTFQLLRYPAANGKKTLINTVKYNMTISRT